MPQDETRRMESRLPHNDARRADSGGVTSGADYANGS